MNSKYKTLLKDTLVFAMGSLGSKLILFFLVPLYTNYLSTEEYGISDLVSTFSQLLIPITSLVIGNAVIRFGMKNSEKPEDVAVASFVVLGMATVLMVLITPLLGLYEPIREWRVYLCFQVIFSNFAEIEKTYLKVKNRNRWFSIISIIQTAALAGTNVLLIIVFHFGIRGYLISNIVAAAIGTLIAFFVSNLHHDLRKGKLDISLLKRMVLYSSPLIASNVSWWVVHSSDKIMIEGMITASALGIYTAATKIPSLINVIIAIFNQAWGISSIREIESTSDTGFYKSVFRLFCVVLFGACLFFIMFIKPFMDIYVGDEYKEAWRYTPLLLVAAVFYSVTAFIGSMYSALQQTKHDMWTTVLCATINVVANYFGIKLIGTWGAILGTVTAFFVCSIVRLIDINRLMSFKVPLSYWINTFIIICYSIIITLQLRVFIVSILVSVLFIVVNRKELFLFFDRINSGIVSVRSRSQ